MSKNIGILTYHFAINYGAALQCYALKTAVNSFGEEAHVLNLVTPQQEKNNSLFYKRKGIKNLAIQIALLPFLKKRISKNNKFRAFVDNYFDCSKKVSNKADLSSLLDEQSYHTVIVGSDQVWCPFIEDFTELFFLPMKCNFKKVGYAVSIGKCQKHDLLSYKPYIDNFSRIGVRERSAIDVLNKITQNSLTEVVDPTLLLSKGDWTAIADKASVKIKKPYLICYFLKKENFISYKLAQNIAKNKNLEIYYINQRYSRYSFLKNTICDAGPEDFVSLLRNADCVCTDSFHGTLFSIIFQKDFYTFVDSQKSHDRRRQDMLLKLDLMDRCIFLDDIVISKSCIDYDDVQLKLSKFRKNSLNFLRSSIVDVEMSYE